MPSPQTSPRRVPSVAKKCVNFRMDRGLGLSSSLVVRFFPRHLPAAPLFAPSGLEVVDRVLRCLRHRCADAGPRLHPGGAGREAVQRLGVHADGELPRVERTLPEGPLPPPGVGLMCDPPNHTPTPVGCRNPSGTSPTTTAASSVHHSQSNGCATSQLSASTVVAETESVLQNSRGHERRQLSGSAFKLLSTRVPLCGSDIERGDAQ